MTLEGTTVTVLGFTPRAETKLKIGCPKCGEPTYVDTVLGRARLDMLACGHAVDFTFGPLSRPTSYGRWQPVVRKIDGRWHADAQLIDPVDQADRPVPTLLVPTATIGYRFAWRARRAARRMARDEHHMDIRWAELRRVPWEPA